jgi:hypothetical protein
LKTLKPVVEAGPVIVLSGQEILYEEVRRCRRW